MSLIVVSVITLWKQIVSSNCTSLTLSPLHLHFLPWSSSPLVRARVMDAGPFKQIRPRTVLSFLLHITLWFVSAIITCDSGSCFQLSLSLPIFHFSCHLDSCFTVNRVDYCSSFYCVPLWFRLQPLKGLLRRLSILLVVSLDPSVCETSSTIQQLSSASIIARSPLSPSTAFPAMYLLSPDRTRLGKIPQQAKVAGLYPCNALSINRLVALGDERLVRSVETNPSLHLSLQHISDNLINLYMSMR